nr:unnamed protein product [Amyelois transitella]
MSGSSLILLSVCLYANGQVVPEHENPAISLNHDITVHAKHFRKIVQDFVTSNQNTTEEQSQNISKVLDEFFKRLAVDLNDVLMSDKEWVQMEKIEDGFMDEKFDEIKKNIQHQYPEITDNAANEMMYRLRRNLFEAKLQFDQIMGGKRLRKK